MPKTKQKVEEVPVKKGKGTVEEEKVLDPDLILGEPIIAEETEESEEADEETDTLDEDEADPFKDRWEE